MASEKIINQKKEEVANLAAKMKEEIGRASCRERV